MVNRKTAASKKSASTSTAKKATAPVVDQKSRAANDAPVVESTVAANAEPVAAKAPKAAPKPKEEFLVKLRSKGDLLKALKADGVLFLENGLWRLDPGREDKKVHRVSKRRAVAFRQAEIVLPTTQPGSRANSFVLNLAKAAEVGSAEERREGYSGSSGPQSGGEEVIVQTIPTDKASAQLAFRISGRKTRDDWRSLVPVAWFRPDVRDSVPPVLHLPNCETTISPARMCINILAGCDELDWRDWWLWKQGFWSDEQYRLALEANEASRQETREALRSAYAWEAQRRLRS
jgi:hypothetical protein